MTIAAAILVLALTRSEIIERFRAPAMVKAGGLVQVVADCPPGMRREYQAPVADFAAGICRRLYASEKIRQNQLPHPGILIFIGDEKTNNTSVVSSPKKRDDGTSYTRIYLPSPAFSDLEKFRVETVKAFYLAVTGEAIGDAEAVIRLRRAFPGLRADDEYAALSAWREGNMDGKDDEYFLKLERTIIVPGEAREKDVLDFASKLYLYPPNHMFPFCGKYRCLSFRRAIAHSSDIAVRLSAASRFSQIVVSGGGRGETLAKAAEAYSGFLRELASGEADENTLSASLDKADHLLSLALDETRRGSEGQQR